MSLSSIYEWSIDHIKHVFEAKTEEDSLEAIDDTFSHHIEIIMNGKELSRGELQKFVLAMVKSSGFRLGVSWQNAVEVPRDDSNRVSSAIGLLKRRLNFIYSSNRMASSADTILFEMFERLVPERRPPRNLNDTSLSTLCE